MQKKLTRSEARKRLASIDWDNLPFGHVSDAELARRLKIDDKSLIRYRRNKRGIAPQTEHAQACIKGMVLCASIDWDSQPLGRVSDGELAKTLGCQRATVMRHREKRGIEPFDRNMKRIERFVVKVDEGVYDIIFKNARKKKMPISTYVWKFLRENLKLE